MSSRKRTLKEVYKDKSERLMNGIAAWTAFYRANPQRFCSDFLNVHLKLFQKILIWAMMNSTHFCFIACRGSAF